MVVKIFLLNQLNSIILLLSIRILYLGKYFQKGSCVNHRFAFKKTMKACFKDLMAFVLMILIVTVSSATSSEGNPAKDKRYYQVVFIWVKDPVKFQEYGEKMGPIVSKYGGAGERILSPINSIYAGNSKIEQPHMVNIVYYDSKEAYEQFEQDPDFLKIKHLRSESIEMAGIGGYAIGGELSSGGVAERLYMLEMAYFKDGKAKPYDTYRKKSKDFYDKHRLFTERILEPDNVFGNIQMPDRVSILYHDTESRKDQLQEDPRHKEIEGLYVEAISDLIWIEGKAAFINMD